MTDYLFCKATWVLLEIQRLEKKEEIQSIR